MNSIVKFGSALALVAIFAAPASALAYYPYTYFTGQDYFNGGGGFYVQQPNYYGSSNCNDIYGCGTIGYNAMTGQGYGMWAGGPTNGIGYNSYGYGGYGGYGQTGGCYSCGVYQNNSYMQYIPQNARQYMMGYGNYGGYGYGGGYGGYVY